MDLQSRLKTIKMVILDVDGVLTDGSVIYADESFELKIFDIKDGLGIRMLIAGGLIVSIITGRTSAAVARRAGELGIQDVYLGKTRKTEAYAELLGKYGFTGDEVACIGDDLYDIPLLRRVGFPVAVADAVDEVKQVARYITQKAGGRGAVREVSDLILKNQNKWEEILRDFGIHD
ncbi:HAD hydrolase family protein [candidate division KSB1 bacterium]|nr:HAD hydrolase family protein [candidate division KSB1 bacterium]